MRAIDLWSWTDVDEWLKTQPALARYADQELKVFRNPEDKISRSHWSDNHSLVLQNAQGTTGRDLLQLDAQLLEDIGIINPLHRLQLINRRDELLQEGVRNRLKGEEKNRDLGSKSLSVHIKVAS